MKKISDRPVWAQNIVKFRKAAGLTQAELGEAINRSAATMRKFEIGALKPSFTVVSAIAETLGVNPYDIMDTDTRLDEQGDDYIDKQFHILTRWVPDNYAIVDHGGDIGKSQNDIEIMYSQPGQVPASIGYQKTTLITDITAIKVDLDKKYDAEYKQRLKDLYNRILPPANKGQKQ